MTTPSAASSTTPLLNSAPVPDELRARYAEDNSEPLLNDLDQIRALGVTPILGDYLDATHFARHAADRIALDLLNLPTRLPRDGHTRESLTPESHTQPPQ